MGRILLYGSRSEQLETSTTSLAWDGRIGLHHRQLTALRSHGCGSAIERLQCGQLQPFQYCFYGCNPLIDAKCEETGSSRCDWFVEYLTCCTETIHIVLPNTTYNSQRGALGFDDECNNTSIYYPYLECSSSTRFVKIASLRLDL